METKDTSSCMDSEEMEMQRLQKKTLFSKGGCMNGLRALKLKLTCFSWEYAQGVTESDFKRTFSLIFGEDVDTFTKTFSQNMDTLEQQLTIETVHKSNCQTDFRVLKTPFEKNFSSVLIKSSHFDVDANLVVMKSRGTESAKHLKELVDSSVYRESSGAVSGTQNVNSSLRNECNI
ncbi:hypothetical protein Tco_1079284 [Tanacetum coccineum]|uniref:Uncharacterized protein n=1 Tax=Tanacetum coccineum TaxID=301880 RepID=A0ABQ5HSA8_9ASTR